MRIFNSVLMHEPPFFRKLEEGKLYSRDASAFPFMIEEIVSYGAVSIGVPAGSLSIFALDSLPAILRRRIKILDKGLHTLKMDRAFREPICKEFGLKREFPGKGVITFEQPLPKPIGDAILCLETEWYLFMLGLKNGLQINVDVSRIRKAALLLRKHTKDSATRAVLATMAGILAPYRPTQTEVIEMVPAESGELVQTFLALVEDETYRAISKEFHNIGFPSRLREGLSRITTLSKRIVRKSKFKNIVTMGTKTITAATQIPLPDGELGERLLQKNYLPPTLNLAPALKKAKDAWERSRCEFSPLKIEDNKKKKRYK